MVDIRSCKAKQFHPGEMTFLDIDHFLGICVCVLIVVGIVIVTCEKSVYGIQVKTQVAEL